VKNDVKFSVANHDFPTNFHPQIRGQIFQETKQDQCDRSNTSTREEETNLSQVLLQEEKDREEETEEGTYLEEEPTLIISDSHRTIRDYAFIPRDLQPYRKIPGDGYCIFPEGRYTCGINAFL
jgi:hypothetical protein